MLQYDCQAERLQLFEDRPDLEIAVIPGNHDRHTVGQALGSRIRWLEEGTLEPSFGEFTGGAPVQPDPQDKIIAVGPGGLMDLSPPEPAHA
jgi:metallophosphoesterase superfamily enzyme